MSQNWPEETPGAVGPGPGQAGNGPYGQPQQYGYGQPRPGYQEPGSPYGYPGYQTQAPGMVAGRPGYGPPQRSEDRIWAMLAYLSPIVVSFVGPLVIYFIKKDESPFSRFHAAQSLNMIITSTIYAVGLLILGIVAGAVTHGVGFLLFLMIWLAFGITTLVYLIIATVAAYRGERYQVPSWLGLRMVR